MRCKICQREFKPSKYRPNQEACSQPECQKQRQAQNLKDWRQKNPDYFKYLGQEPIWRDSRRQYNKLWRNTHEDYLEKYEIKRKKQRRTYMREYMRRKRGA